MLVKRSGKIKFSNKIGTSFLTTALIQKETKNILPGSESSLFVCPVEIVHFPSVISIEKKLHFPLLLPSHTLFTFLRPYCIGLLLGLYVNFSLVDLIFSKPVVATFLGEIFLLLTWSLTNDVNRTTVLPSVSLTGHSSGLVF